MKAATVALSFAMVLTGCGEAVSINAEERKAEDVRREAVRDADDADTVKVRDAAAETYARDRDAPGTALGEATPGSDL